MIRHWYNEAFEKESAIKKYSVDVNKSILLARNFQQNKYTIPLWENDKSSIVLPRGNRKTRAKLIVQVRHIKIKLVHFKYVDINWHG